MDKGPCILGAIFILSLLLAFTVDRNIVNWSNASDISSVLAISTTNGSSPLKNDSSLISKAYPINGNSVLNDSLNKLMSIGNLTLRKEAFLKNITNETSSVEASGSLRAPVLSTISYTPKFVCGAISSTEGPLRPGYYDTDISIFNKQKYPIKFLWNVVLTDGPSSNAIIKKLSAETSTKISCSDLLTLLPTSTKFFEGFVVITLPISGNILGAFPDPRNNEISIYRPVNADNPNLIDVQVFYSANALPHLAQSIIVDKVTFRILEDPSGKIPRTSLNMDLEIPLQIEADKIYDSSKLIKNTLIQQYGLTQVEANKTKIMVAKTDTSTTFQQDDHAISSSRINPDVNYAN